MSSRHQHIHTTMQIINCWKRIMWRARKWQIYWLWGPRNNQLRFRRVLWIKGLSKVIWMTCFNSTQFRRRWSVILAFLIIRSCKHRSNLTTQKPINILIWVSTSNSSSLQFKANLTRTKFFNKSSIKRGVQESSQMVKEVTMVATREIRNQAVTWSYIIWQFKVASTRIKTSNCGIKNIRLARSKRVGLKWTYIHHRCRRCSK